MTRPVDRLYTGRTEAIEAHECFRCGRPAIWFSDEVSLREYRPSGLCQDCQDDIFVDEDEALFAEYDLG